ncbi:MAG: PAS domain S-box protein [Proteobacteria bacterium]|nr:MAG: PAS domain S-box protein [Pseudomonadota bacterium]
MPLPHSKNAARVAALISSGAAAILARWESSVRAEVSAAEGQSGPALRNHLPSFLEAIVKALLESASPTTASSASAVGAEHGTQRATLSKYSLSQLLREYRLLRAELIRHLEAEGPLESADRAFLHDFIDRAIETAAGEFSAGMAHAQQSRNRETLLARFAQKSAWDIDLNTGEIWWNEHLLNQFGYGASHNPIRSDWWIAQLHPEDEKATMADIRERLESADPGWTGEFRMRRADGAYVHVLATAHILRDENGRAERVVGTIKDISPQKSEAMLRRRAELARDTLFNLPGVLFSISDEREVFQDLSPAWTDLLGYSAEELKSRSLLDFVHPDDLAVTQAETKLVLQGKSGGSFFNRYRTKAGHYVWLQWTADVKEGVIYSFASNVSAIKETENQLLAWRNRFERVSESTGLGVWYCDLPFDELNWNKETKDHFWLPHDARVDIDLFYERIHPEDREFTRASIAESIRSGERYDIEYRTTNPADPEEHKWLRAVGWTAYHDSQPVSFDGFTMDITETKRVEEELAESQNAILENEQLLKLITDRLPAFVAYVDHDLNYRFLNDAYRRCFGVNARSGQPMREVVNAQAFERALPFARQALRGEVVRYENTVTSANGDELIVEAEYLPDFHPRTGQVRGYVVVGHDITARKKAARALEEGERRLRLAVQAARIGIFDYNVATGVALLNDEFINDWGLAPGQREVRLEELMPLIHPEYRGLVAERMRATIENGAPYDYEARIVHGISGDTRWMETKAELTYTPDGQADRMIGTTVDITDRMETELALKERSELFRLITDTIPHGVWRTNPDGTGDYFSKRFRDLVGYPIEALLGWGWAELIHPEDQPRVLKAWEEGRAAMAPVSAEFRVRSAEGRYRWFISQGNPFFDGHGNLIKYYGTWTEIEEQKARASQLQKLAETSLKLNSTLALNEKLSLLTEQARHIVGAHQAALRIEPRGDETAPHLSSSFSSKAKNSRENLLAPIHSGLYQHVLHLNQVVKFTQAELETNPIFRQGREGGPPRHGLLAAPLVNTRGEAIGVLKLSDKYDGEFSESDVGIFAQLAQIASAAIENAQLLEREQAAVIARDEFLSIASHELKTPLTSLKLQSQIFTRMVQKGDPRAYDPTRLNAVMDQTTRQVTRLTRLVDDMLDISRIRTGKLSITLEPGSFAELVRESAERMQPLFRKEKAPDPQVTILADGSVNLDTVRMEQVINNLLTNALRYGKGSVVEVQLEESDSALILKVSDQGIGIDQANLEKIFDRFERAVSANEVSGLGLGLFISRQIVRAHGGRIWAESRAGKGTSFYVELPKL